MAYRFESGLRHHLTDYFLTFLSFFVFKPFEFFPLLPSNSRHLRARCRNDGISLTPLSHLLIVRGITPKAVASLPWL